MNVGSIPEHSNIDVDLIAWYHPGRPKRSDVPEGVPFSLSESLFSGAYQLQTEQYPILFTGPGPYNGETLLVMVDIKPVVSATQQEAGNNTEEEPEARDKIVLKTNEQTDTLGQGGFGQGNVVEFTPHPSIEEGTSSKTLEEILALPIVRLSASNIHLSEIVARIGEESNINIVVDNRAVYKQPSQGEQTPEDEKSDPFYGPKSDGMIDAVELREVALSKVLEALLKPLGLNFSVAPNFIFVSKENILARETFEALETRFYDLKQETLDALNKADNSTSMTLQRYLPAVYAPSSNEVLSDFALLAEEHKLVVRNAPSNLDHFEKLLEVVQEDPARFFQPSTTTNTDPNNHSEEANSGRAVRPRIGREIMMPLSPQSLSLRVTNGHISTLVTSLGGSRNMNIMVDDRVVAAPRTEGQPAPEYHPNNREKSDGVISRIDLDNVSLGEALTALTKPLGLSYAIGEYSIFISRPDILDSMRTYPYDINGDGDPEPILVYSSLEISVPTEIKHFPYIKGIATNTFADLTQAFVLRLQEDLNTISVQGVSTYYDASLNTLYVTGPPTIQARIFTQILDNQPAAEYHGDGEEARITTYTNTRGTTTIGFTSKGRTETFPSWSPGYELDPRTVPLQAHLRGSITANGAPGDEHLQYAYQPLIVCRSEEIVGDVRTHQAALEEYINQFHDQLKASPTPSRSTVTQMHADAEKELKNLLKRLRGKRLWHTDAIRLAYRPTLSLES